MIGYVTVGTNDITRAAAFYDALFAEVAMPRSMASETFVAWASAPDKPSFGVTKPFNGQPATVGNGVMVALAAANPEQVKQLYAKAMALGASDEGKPGFRGDSGYYAAYFRDLDGNKLNFFCFVAPS